MSEHVSKTDLLNKAMIWDFACPDWEQRLAARQSLLPSLPLDERKATLAVSFFDKMRLPDVAGNPTLKEAGGDWQRDIVRAVFGSLDDAGRRHVQQVFSLVPKKNSKSTGGAAIMLVALLMNNRPRAEFLLVGPTQEIANNAFEQASGMVRVDDYLSTRFLVREHIKTIEDRTNGSTLKIKTFDMKVMTGAKPAGVLIDELHVMSSMSFASRVIRQIRGAFMARSEGFLIFITTQSDQVPAGVFKEELKHARSVRDGKVIGKAANILPLLYEFPESVQTSKDRAWENPEIWPLVTPNLGLSVSMEAMVADFEAEKSKSEEALRVWASQHLNLQMGTGLHDERWRGADYWADAVDETIDSLETLLERSEVVTVGVDMGGTDDLLGLYVVGKEIEGSKWFGWGHAWAVTSVEERRKSIAQILSDFEEAGELTVLDDLNEIIIDVSDVIEQIYMSGKLPAEYGVGFDAWGTKVIISELERREIMTQEQGGPLTGVSQGVRLGSSIRTLEWRLKSGDFCHGDQAIMRWCVDNAKAVLAGNNIKIEKSTAGTAKIDPLIAAFNAVSLMDRNPVAANSLTSPWDDPNYRHEAA
jgi:phage terminase large subunit-like protein